ncbi:CoA-binding protein [Flavihumibacter cheonanensis]|jgi:predicted CoA-binding protein|uniref:CoA-binding protein n=1 Tax=Flavihumibacter cheonanensis TaxID=1442385 RepID=UPI001EF98841|nr:CoA-binding protein [Flavihumibacter cheonanensis]MCG7753587.1 CoA-binding protein [Flavihumibacter cheonanensis]
MSDPKKTLVLGASENPSRYSYLAIQSLVSHHHPVVAIGRRPGMVNDVPIQTDLPTLEEIDTVTLYLSKENQAEYIPYILSLKPKRIIFNPGAENPDLVRLARENQIYPQEACTLVLLSTGQY